MAKNGVFGKGGQKGLKDEDWEDYLLRDCSGWVGQPSAGVTG